MPHGFSVPDILGRGEPSRPAILDDGAPGWICYGALAARVAAAARRFARPRRSLVFLPFPNRIDAVVAYLGLLTAGHVPALLDPALPAELMAALATRYRPLRLTGAPGDERLDGADDGPVLHPELGLLLSTSGSTGSPKLVRLGLGALGHNTAAIVEALRLGPSDRAAAHLPLHYAFGLSVLNTHLAAGASLVLTEGTPLDPGFWDRLHDTGCTSLAVTPFHMEILDRLGFDRVAPPSLAVITQAGGRLAPDRAERAHRLMAARGGRFYVMYGQTEAAPRLATLPPESFAGHAGSVGQPLADGRFFILDGEGQPLPTGRIGQVHYQGPNVMMGYACGPDDLALGDVMGGRLPTGDLGRLDADGFLYLTGRANRYAKIAGRRISLDEVEGLAEATGPLAAVETDGRLLIVVQGGQADDLDGLRRRLARRLRLPAAALRTRAVDRLPVTSKGKVDYRRLAEEGA
jgi:acyl-CoA synthetase (AMP-forming)/AMP-acid ligase II